jgi:hypothetical protein
MHSVTGMGARSSMYGVNKALRAMLTPRAPGLMIELLIAERPSPAPPRLLRHKRTTLCTPTLLIASTAAADIFPAHSIVPECKCIVHLQLVVQPGAKRSLCIHTRCAPVPLFLSGWCACHECGCGAIQLPVSCTAVIPPPPALPY